MRQDGFSEFWDECAFEKIEQEGSAYLIHMSCEDQETRVHFTLNEEYKIVDGRLVVTLIPEI
jgi:hypothetical protein